jgi:hypothetical protein
VVGAELAIGAVCSISSAPAKAVVSLVSTMKFNCYDSYRWRLIKRLGADNYSLLPQEQPSGRRQAGPPLECTTARFGSSATRPV